MARAPGVVTHGTAKDLANAGVGYTASGEGEFSRQAAHPATNMRLPKSFGGVNTANGQRLITKNLIQIAKLKTRAALERDPIVKTEILRRIAVKRDFIARLSK